MDSGALYFQNVRPDLEFINKVLLFDVNYLESTDGSVLSQYTIALAQYLVFFKSQVNKVKAEIYKLESILEEGVGMLLTKELLKTYKTKKDAFSYVVSQSADLSKIKDKILTLQEEMVLVDGMDKPISELIAVFKRELTRRENELYATRMERR
jgi:uncharacterized hydantoinase/oxoprolinase family protein